MILLQKYLAEIHELQNTLEVFRCDVCDIDDGILVESALAEEFVKEPAGGVEDESVTLELDPILTDQRHVLAVLTLKQVPQRRQH